jgi:hypothetical protein
MRYTGRRTDRLISHESEENGMLYDEMDFGSN